MQSQSKFCCVVRASLVVLFTLATNTSASASNPSPFKVAAIQFNPELKKLKPNVERLVEQFEKAATKGAKILVAPEMATTGYLYESRADIKDFVDTIPGKTTRRFAQVSRKHNCYIAWGMAEVDSTTGLYYNSMALVGPEGYVGKYRKLHLWESESHWSAYGNLGMPVFQTELGNLALVVCQDANYMETFRLALLGGADIVCFATNSSGQTVGRLQARSIQNGLYVISANRCNVEKDFRMRGCSAVWSPKGEKLCEAPLDKEAIVFASICPDQYRLKNRILAQRRPKRYLNLIRHIAPWNSLIDHQVRRVQGIALQYEPVPGDLQENMKKVNLLLQEHAWQIQSFSQRKTLVVLPELSFLGHPPSETMAGLAETFAGPSATFVKGLAKRYQCFIAFGLAERDEQNRCYNTVVLVNPEGTILGKARKVHLNVHDRDWATSGNLFVVVETNELGRVGLLVGSDAYMPESGVILAINRANLVAAPSSWHGECAGDGQIRINPAINPHNKMGGMVLWDNLAWECTYYLVVANFVGSQKQYLGRSGIYTIDPIYDQRSPALAGVGQNEKVITGVFDSRKKDHWTTQATYIGSRRARGKLYYPLIQSYNKIIKQ